jgi:hypothetical protein
MTAEPFAVRRRAARPPANARDVGPSVRFSREEILAAIRLWVDRHGAPPSSADWEPSRARATGEPWRIDRFNDGTWPSLRMVRRQFGTLGEAIRAAGFAAPHSRGRKRQLAGPEEILRAVRAWVVRYGEPPAQSDWDPVRARLVGQSWREVRYREGDWPTVATVRRHFGTHGAALRAAGFLPRPAAESASARATRRDANRRTAARVAAATSAWSGADALAHAVRAVARARASRSAGELEAALMMLAGVALQWADVARAEV